MNDIERNQLQYFLKQATESADYFSKWFERYDSEILDDQNSPLKKSLFWDIHDAFLKHNQSKTENPDTYAHNCIGCNLEEGARAINYFLQTNKECFNVQYYLNIYSFLFYAQAERLAVIYKEIGFVNGYSEFDWEKFPNLQLIKYWANFFKHPKAYMFLHHPEYYIVSDPEKPNFLITLIIDNRFVDRFYQGKKHNTELRELLENKDKVKIFFPDLVETTKTLCEEFEKIIGTITSDSDIIEKLNAYTTIETED